MLLDLIAQIQDPAEAARQVLEQTATTPVEPTMETISIWELIKNGGWYIMGPLGLMSLLAEAGYRFERLAQCYPDADWQVAHFVAKPT